MKLSRVRFFNEIWSDQGLTFDEKLNALDEQKQREVDPEYLIAIQILGESKREILGCGNYQKKKRKPKTNSI